MKSPSAAQDPKFTKQQPIRIKRRCRHAMVLAAMSLPFVCGTPASAAVLKKAELTAVINEVKLLDPTAGERGAKVKDVVEGKTGVKTGIKSRAELLFQDKTLTRLGANTLFSFSEGTRDLELENGTMLLQCPKGVGGAKIRTAAVTAAITGTTILLEYSPAPTPKRRAGYIPTIAEMTPEECLAELQHPRRNYTKAERSALAAKARQRKKGGSGGYVKVLVLEGTLRLYLNTRVGESVLISAGHMIILDPQAITIPPAVEFDIARLAESSLLVDNKAWGGKATDLNMALVAREVTIQEGLKDRGQLLVTNLVIPGAGTEVVTLAQLNQSIEAQTIAFLSQLPVNQGAPPGPVPSGAALLTSGSAPAGPSSPLVTITSPNPYVVGSNTTFKTDPTVTTGGVTSTGLTYRNATLDGPLTIFDFGSTSAFDSYLEFGTYYKDAPNGDATFKFSKLTITGQPTIDTTAGATNMSLISEGAITSAAPLGTTIDLDTLDGLFLGTINGPITLGPELSFTSARTAPLSTNYNQPFDLGLYLEAYARGASSDVVFDSTVNFVDRDLRLEAEHDVKISGNITVLPSNPRSFTYSDVQIVAGNNFIMDAGGQINTDTLSVDATDVVGTGGTSVFARQITFSLRNAVTLTQPGPVFLVDTLGVQGKELGLDQVISSLQTLNINSDHGIALPGDIIPLTPGFSLSLATNQDPVSGGIVSINGIISPASLSIYARDLDVLPNALIQAANVDIHLTETASPVVLSQSSGQLSFRSLPIDSTLLSSLNLSAPSINISTDLNLPSVTVDLYGNVAATGKITVDSIGFASIDGTSPVSDTVSGNLDAPSGLSLPAGSLTVGGSVTANLIEATFGSTGSPSSLSAASVSAPGGLNFPGSNGLPNSDGTYTAPTDGNTLTLTATTVNSVSFGTATFDGGDAAAGSGMPGGNGGTLNVNSPGDITVNSPISATTGANDTGITSGGKGGNVNLDSNNGAVTVNSTIQVSSDGLTAPTKRVSKQGGNISLHTSKASGAGINVTSSGQLLSLLSSTAPGPGGTIQVISEGADINVSGRIQADKGTIDVHNNGASGNGNVFINSTAQLAADIIKVGALGNNGVLTVQAGSRINAANTLLLYGGTGAAGKVLFTGAGNVDLPGSAATHIRATTVQIDSTTHVNNSGPTSVYTTNANFGKSGYGNFQNPVTRSSSPAPGF